MGWLVIHLVTNGLHRRAGTERVIFNLASALATKQGITVWVPGRTDCCFGEGSINVESAGVGDFPQYGLLPKLRNRLLYFAAIYCAIKRDDTLLGFALDLNVMLIMIARLKGARVVACEHIHYDYHNNFRKFIRWWAYRFKKTVVVVLTARDKEKFEKIGVEAVVIPNFVDQNDNFLYSQAKFEFKSILAIGRLVTQKDFSFLICAFAMSGLSLEGWKLNIVGDGPLLERLKNEITVLGVASSVQILEPTDQIISLYQTASIFCLTSEFEAFPMVLLEAMAQSLPVLALDCPTGPREILPVKGGQLVEGRDVRAFADRLVEIVTSYQTCEYLARLNFNHVERFSKNRTFRRWLSVLTNESN
jgi:glycosyltransferase involved in cell wall biosynthesis